MVAYGVQNVTRNICSKSVVLMLGISCVNLLLVFDISGACLSLQHFVRWHNYANSDSSFGLLFCDLQNLKQRGFCLRYLRNGNRKKLVQYPASTKRHASVSIVGWFLYILAYIKALLCENIKSLYATLYCFYLVCNAC